MKNINQMIRKLIAPHWFILMILVSSCTAGLIFVFVNDLEQSLPAYCLYPVSAYTLCVSVYHLIKWGIRVKKDLKKVKILQPYFNDNEYRKIVSMSSGMFVSFVFAVFKLQISCIYRTVWEFAVGIYYLVLCLIRTNLMRVVKKGTFENEQERIKTEWVNYLRTGVFMFVLNAAMSGMAVLMIWENKTNSYPGFVIYVSALHAFYSLINACVQMFKFKNSGRPVFYSVNAVNLAGALMSIFILQTGLIQMFAKPGFFSIMMNVLTATVVLAAVFAMAVVMVIQGIKNVKEFNL